MNTRITTDARPNPSKRLGLVSALVALSLGGFALNGCSNSPSGSATAPAAEISESSVQTPVATQETTPEPDAAKPAIGTPFIADMGNGNIAKITIVSAERTDSVANNQFAPPPEKGQYLLLDVLWETEEGVTSSNPLYFKAKDTDGRQADLSMFADDQLGSGEVPVGDKARGFVAFDVAPGPITVIITNPILQEVARIEVP